MRHVIIGNGPAGVIAAETLRKHAPSDDILLIGDEPQPPYSRMSIPQLLSGQLHEAGTYLRREKDYFSRLRIAQKTGRADHVSGRTRTVKMDDGSAIEFDRLLIATGASPRAPAIPGIELPGVHACWTLDDARAIMQLAKPRSRVVLIGAGFIGCIVMEALAARGVHLAVVEKRDRMLPNMMGRAAGEMVGLWCERKGIRVYTSARVTGIGCTHDSTSPRSVRLSNGEQLQADLIVYSVGSEPNIGFLKGCGIKCLRGVVVDASMQTSMPGVYAAGDCAETFDPETGRSIISGVQPNAADQAYCAALNMAGKHAFQRSARQIDVLDTMGLISSSFGQWQGVRGGQWVEFSDSCNFRYLRLEFRRDVLIGCNAIGLTEHSGILRALIRQQVRLGEWKDKLLHNPLALKEAYSECVQQQYTRQASAFYVPRAYHAGAAAHLA
ncbi:NAD(P)/FAD-dependent oxidoreductase [Noviherbaspirillum sp. UKPF54]|uniref:NAD(P)/FAD-dependent oxidoreductase n=1 Tax=Noviherbaspirillum sp. UKPF54 TaxID=2601898 RepID=UPI0011B1439D|nr:FAD-dependent oxidoreductase [Noviherbaspirillum sp. UKPF54]QDZ27307.1 NAD(P)/FAD-dependent oxidoreductase [Noviherbaspirillum sp. UKPF54]